MLNPRNDLRVVERSPTGARAPRRFAYDDAPALEMLSAEDQQSILQHLLELSSVDRHLRFCSALPDAAVADYVSRLGFERDLVVGYREEGKLVALAHLAALRKPGEAELGISVARARRGRGIGVRLTGEAFELARKVGFRRVHIYYRGENLPMGAIVGHYPAPVHRECGDNEVCVLLDLAA